MSVEKKDMILTVAGLRKLERELEYLKMVKRREVAERIKQAIEFGDITDSSEYEDAKNEQAFIEGRIITLEKALRNAKVIDAEDVGTEEVGIGSTVRLKDLNGGEELQYTIVGSMESDPRSNKISAVDQPMKRSRTADVREPDRQPAAVRGAFSVKGELFEAYTEHVPTVHPTGWPQSPGSAPLWLHTPKTFSTARRGFLPRHPRFGTLVGCCRHRQTAPRS